MAEERDPPRRESEQDRARREESERAIRRADADTDLLGTSALARAARHFTGADAPQDDRIEVWGRRIGRFLAVLFAIYLVISLADHFNR
jgi:hypothetical protein